MVYIKNIGNYSLKEVVYNLLVARLHVYTDAEYLHVRLAHIKFLILCRVLQAHRVGAIYGVKADWFWYSMTLV